MHSRTRFLSLLALLAGLSFIGPALAGSHEQDTVRQAVESGAIRPLADILNDLRGQLPGDVIGAEIEHKNGLWVYEFDLLDGSGRLFEARVNAQSGRIERIKEK